MQQEYQMKHDTSTAWRVRFIMQNNDHNGNKSEWF